MTLSRLSPLFAFLVLLVFSACAGDPEPAPEAPAAPELAAAPAAPTASAQKINLNTATSDDFRTIPGVGDRMVHEFEEYRPYVSIQQFRREIGKYVDEAQVAAYEQYVFVPIRYNDSDAETLQQIPGLDADEAAQIVAGRPYASRDAFLEKVASYTDEAGRSVALAYVAEE